MGAGGMRGASIFLRVLLTGAVLAATQALADDNDRAVSGFYLKAGAAEQRGRLDDAIAAYGGIIKLRPADADAWRDRAVIEAAKKDGAAASRDLNQAIRLQPRDARAYVERGKLYAAAGQFESALADFDEALHLNPDYAGALTAKAAVYDYQHNYDGAITAMNQLLKMQPQNAELLNGRCWERALANRELKIAEADCAAALRACAHSAADIEETVAAAKAALPKPSPSMMACSRFCRAPPKRCSAAAWRKAATRMRRAARPISQGRCPWTRMRATKWRVLA